MSRWEEAKKKALQEREGSRAVSSGSTGTGESGKSRWELAKEKALQERGGQGNSVTAKKKKVSDGQPQPSERLWSLKAMRDAQWKSIEPEYHALDRAVKTETALARNANILSEKQTLFEENEQDVRQLRPLRLPQQTQIEQEAAAQKTAEAAEQFRPHLQGYQEYEDMYQKELKAYLEQSDAWYETDAGKQQKRYDDYERKYQDGLRGVDLVKLGESTAGYKGTAEADEKSYNSLKEKIRAGYSFIREIQSKSEAHILADIEQSVKNGEYDTARPEGLPEHIHWPPQSKAEYLEMWQWEIAQAERNLQNLKTKTDQSGETYRFADEEYQYYLGRIYYDAANDADADAVVERGKMLHQKAWEDYGTYLHDMDGYYGALALSPEGDTSALAPFMNQARSHYPLAIMVDSLTEENQRIFYYLVGKGQDSLAIQFANEAASESRQQTLQDIRDWAGSNIGTQLLASAGSFALLPYAWSDPILSQDASVLTGLQNTGGVFGSIKDNLRAGVSEAWNDAVGTLPESVPVLGGKGLGDLYQLGMSMGDSYLSGKLFGSDFASVVLGSNAMSSAFNDAMDKGADTETALMQGFAQGAAEMLFERISLGAFFDGNISGGAIKQALAQGGIEASEELCTSIANHFTDKAIMGDLSEYELAKKMYLENGKNLHEAEQLAKKDFYEGLIFDALGGFLSGGAMGGGAAAIESHQRKKAQGMAEQSTAVNDNPATHTQEEMRTIEEYKNSTDSSLRNRFSSVANDKNTDFFRQKISPVSERQAQDAGRLLGGDYSGYTNNINSNGVRHIINEHGPNGSVDQSMGNLDDAARLGYVLDNYDSVELATYQSGDQDTSAEFRNANNEPAPMLRYSKKVNGTYYVVEAIPESKYKKFWVVSAYMEKTDGLTQARNAQSPANTPEASLASQPSATGSIAQPEQSVKGEDSSDLVRASQKYGRHAKAMAATYIAGQSVTSYDRAFRAAYDMGRSGVNFSYVNKSASAAYLTEAQREIAYEVGKAAAEERANAKDSKNKAAANGKTGRKRGGVVRGEGVKLADLRKAIHDPRGKAYKILSTIAEVTGVNIVLYKSQTDADGNFIGEQGKFDPANPNEIRIDINAGLENISDVGELEKYVLLRTFSHEFTHFIEKWNPVRYNEFRRIVFDTLTERGVDVDSLIGRKMDETGLSYEAASREAVADAMTDILPDSKFVEKLAQKHKTIFEKILEKLKEFAQHIKDYFETVGLNTAVEANALKEQGKYLDSIVKLWDEIAVEAVETYQKTVATEEVVVSGNENTTGKTTTEGNTTVSEMETVHEMADEERVQHQRRSGAADTPRQFSYQWFVDKPDMAITEVDDIRTGKVKNIRNQVIDKGIANAARIGDVNEQGNPVVYVKDIGKGVTVSKSGLRHSMDRRSESVMPVVAKIGDILSNAILLNKLNPRTDNISDSYILIGAAKNKTNEPYIASFVVNRYTSEVTDIDVIYSVNAKTEPAGSLSPSITAKNAGYFTGSTITIAELLGYVNRYFPDVMPEDVLRHYGYDSRPDGILGENVLYQKRTNTLTNREVLSLAAEELRKGDLTAAERDTLDIFEKRLAKLEELQEKRDRYHEVMDLLNPPREEQSLDSDGVDVVQYQRRKNRNSYKNISRQEYRQIQEDRMTKYGDDFENMPGVDYTYAHDLLYVFENLDETRFGVLEIIDPARSKAKADVLEEAFRNGLIRNKQDLGGRLVRLRNFKKLCSVYLSDAGNGGTRTGNDRLDFEVGQYPDGSRVLGTSNGDQEQYQRRTNTLTNREVLALAAEDLRNGDLTAAEWDALDIFEKRLAKLEELQEKRLEQGRLYKELQFGAKVDRVAAEQTRNRMQILDGQIERAKAEVLSIEDKKVLRQVLQKARKIVEKQQWNHDQEVLKRYRERRNDAAAVKKYRERLTKDVKELTDWVLHPNNKNALKHIPDVLKQSVIPFLSSIDFTSKRALNGGAVTQADREFMKRLRGLKAALNPNQNAENLYADYSDLPPNFMERLQTLIDGAQEIVDTESGEFVVNRMSSKELQELSQVVRTLKQYIQNFNRFHVNAMFRHVSEAGDSTISELASMKKASDRVGSVSDFVFWKQIRPAYGMERFGEGGKAIYDGLRRGQAKLAFLTKKIQAFAEKAYTAEEVKAWEKEIKDIRLGDDIVKMPVSTIMSFYELSKREQALGHILGQGIRVATYKANGRKISDSGHAVTPEDVATIIDTLTERQKEVADTLQKFMQEQGGKWGNHVSVKRFGEELFGEEHYFPINSDGRHLEANAEEHPSAASLYALLNMGFTKATVEGATNRLVLYSIFDVFANHMASMAQYNAFALPVVDAIKWFNYQQKNEGGEIINGVRDQMDRVYGVPEESRPGSGRQGYAQSFVINILRAFNGTEAQGVPTDTTGLNALRQYNMAQVAYNFRVVVQQPLAITRAGLLVDYRSIIRGMKLSPAAIRKNIEEMQKHSGIAAWKSLGFYDVNISRGLTEIIKHNSSLRDKINKVGMWGAEKADTMTWAGIWSACKEEVIRKQHLTPESDVFFDAVTQLFENVIYKTQVVDSVLTKNEYLRSKGLFARTMASFMSEPTTSLSMLIGAYDQYHADVQKGMSRQQAWKKNRRMIGRTAYVYALSAVVLAAVQAASDAFRDDDDYQEWYEKWLEAFRGNFIDEISPANKLPILSDVWELGKELLSVAGVDTYGNAPASVFMQWYDSLVKGAEIVCDKISGEDTNYTWYGGVYKLLQAASGMTGLPMAAATREGVTAWNSIVGAMAPSLKVKTYDSGEKNEIKYAYLDGYLSAEEAKEHLLQRELVDDEDEAYWLLRSWDTDGASKYSAVFDAVHSGEGFEEAMKELLDHGYDEDNVLSQVKSQIKTWYTDEESKIRITKWEAADLLRKYFDMDTATINATVTQWTCKVVTGIDYGNIKEEFIDGKIPASRAIEMRMRYGGKSREDATADVSAWNAEKKYGLSADDAKAYTKIIDALGKSAEQVGIKHNVFVKYRTLSANCMGVDADGDGKADNGTKKVEILQVINSLPIPIAQKDALYYLNGWAESKIWEAPWH